MQANGSKFILGGDNPQDPTRNVTASNPKQLFQKFGAVANGFRYDDVIDAAANLIVNSLRQKYDSRANAMSAYSLLMNKVGDLLSSHYDKSTGRRKNIFPFTQHISADHFKDKDNL